MEQLATQDASDQEVWLALQINRLEPAETVLLLRRKDGSLMVRGEDLRRRRLNLPDVAPVLHRGEAYYRLDALPGVSYRVDEPRQALFVEAPAGLFPGTVVSGQSAGFTAPILSPPGGFFNYDVSAGRIAGRTDAGGLFELGAFNGRGAGIGSFLARDLGDGTRFTRLDTTWTRDQPSQLASLRLGDAISSAGSWGRSVRFGGAQWATNFVTQPDLITFPQPGMTGEAVLPSTVDLYVNDALRLRREVPTGPFSIPDLPVVTGQGETRLVVRDLLGRERVIISPYYASPRLLRQGLHDYSYELGSVRDNYGAASNEYGRFVAVGTHRLGFTDHLTGEAHGEFLRDQQSVGLSAALLWPAAGVLSSSIASRSKGGDGNLLALGFERQSRWLSFGGSAQLATERFTQLGLQPGQPAPRQLGQAFISMATGGYGSFGLNYAHQNYRDRDEVKLVSASYSTTLGKLGFLSLSVLRSLGADAKTAVGLIFTRSLGENTSASASATRQADSR
jgi:outer membrane usher protein